MTQAQSWQSFCGQVQSSTTPNSRIVFAVDKHHTENRATVLEKRFKANYYSLLKVY